jgi:hypothetical protein
LPPERLPAAGVNVEPLPTPAPERKQAATMPGAGAARVREQAGGKESAYKVF